MKPRFIRITALILCSLILGAGCSRRPKITELQRKEAAHLSAEADFALNLRDWACAEGLLAKAVQLCPDNGARWINLGVVRVKLGQKPGAKVAYQGALDAYQAEGAADPKNVEPWLKQIYVLALLGRVDEARKLLDRATKQFPESRNVRAFVEGKQLERMMADPMFKQSAL
ncbi:MAG: tetratricopeptide repeat protein [Opitutus sp.]|nr:tetratricopeptide repeat protein [Opitutus sp.]